MLLGFLAAGVVGCAALVALTTRRVKVEASHAAAVLKVSRTWPVIGDVGETYRLETIQGTGLLSRVDSRGRTGSAVTLKTRSGEIPLSGTYAPLGREEQKRALDGFLADPSAPPLGMVDHKGDPAAFLALPVLVVLSLVVRVMWTKRI